MRRTEETGWFHYEDSETLDTIQIARTSLDQIAKVWRLNRQERLLVDTFLRLPAPDREKAAKVISEILALAQIDSSEQPAESINPAHSFFYHDQVFNGGTLISIIHSLSCVAPQDAGPSCLPFGLKK